jgi:hypothetical protein
VDRSRSSSKRSDHAWKQLVEAAIRDVYELGSRGLVFHVDAVEAVGRPPTRLRVFATLRFLRSGSPFCCQEPCCHIDLFGDRLKLVEEHLRHAIGLRHEVTLDLGDRIGVDLAPGVTFQRHEPD